MGPVSLSLVSACLLPSSSSPGGGAGDVGAPPSGATNRTTSSSCCSSMSLVSSNMQQHQQQGLQQHLRLLLATAACSLPRHLRLLTKATIAGGRSGRHLGPPPPPPPPAQHPCMVSLRRRGASSWGHDAMTPPRLPGIVSCGTQALWGPSRHGRNGLVCPFHKCQTREGHCPLQHQTVPYCITLSLDPSGGLCNRMWGKASWG